MYIIVNRTKINFIFNGFKSCNHNSFQMAVVFLLLGTNLGAKLNNLHRAEDLINSNIGDLTNKSAVYQSPPWGFEHEEDFLNRAVQISTKFSADRLLDTIIDIEVFLGRKRAEKENGYLPRIIDIDILLYEDKIVSSDRLTIPHPRMHLRKFALVALNEIAEDKVHPVFGKTIGELLLLCDDNSVVRKLDE